MPFPLIFTPEGLYSTDSITSTFRELATNWIKETALLSSRKQKFEHPDYVKIIGLGTRVVPEIIKWISNGGDGHWDHALATITGERPDLELGAQTLADVRNAWIEWGTRKGYIK